MFIYMTNNRDLDEKINKLKIALKHTMKKWRGQKRIMNYNVFNQFKNAHDQLQVRNITYTNNVIKRVQSNLDDIEKIASDKSKDNRKNEINQKFNSSYLMLESLCSVGKKYNHKDFDYEIMSIKAVNTKLNNIGKSNREDIAFQEDKKKVLEEFETVKVKIVEGFDFSPITDLIDEIGDGFKMVIDGIVRIGKFVVEFLKDFVILLFTILKMIYSFIVDIVPKIVKFLYDTTMKLFQKFSRVGIFSIALIVGSMYASREIYACHFMPFILQIMGVAKDNYESTRNIPQGKQNGGYNELGSDAAAMAKGSKCDPQYIQQASKTIVPYVAFFGLYMFWNKTDDIAFLQQAFFDLVLYIVTEPLKNLFAYIMGIEENDEIFLKSTSVGRKLQLFFIYWYKDLFGILFRIALCILIPFLFYNQVYLKHFDFVVPTVRELVIFPFVILRDFIKLTGVLNLLTKSNE